MQNVLKKYHFSYVLIITLLFIPQCGGRKKLTKKEAIVKKESKEQRPFRYKKIERLTFDEALAVYTFYKKEDRKKPQFGSVIERILTLTTDHDLIYPLLLELADLMFEFQNYKKAEEYYGQHAAMYPGGARIDYVKMRQIESAYKQILDVHRDQTKTKETRKLIELYLPSVPQGSPNREKIQKILDQCYLILLESELIYINFYLHKYHTMAQPKALEAAFKRLEHINTTLLPFMKTEQYQKAHQEITDYFSREEKKQDSATIENMLKLLTIKKSPVSMLNRF